MENNDIKFLLSDKMVKDVKFYLPEENKLNNLADFFSMFSDPTRLKIISALSMSEMCVNDIANILNLNQTTVSHQLKILKSMGTVKYRRDGKVIYYSLYDKMINDCLLVGVDCMQIAGN
ncbi:MAG: winged helix-turn-helix transcriptional regulator [Clostridiales bacterium]|nr:winged helix-turn-helix transcriptional regulator [Candidatus Apopatousia equi]